MNGFEPHPRICAFSNKFRETEERCRKPFFPEDPCDVRPEDLRQWPGQREKRGEVSKGRRYPCLGVNVQFSVIQLRAMALKKTLSSKTQKKLSVCPYSRQAFRDPFEALLSHREELGYFYNLLFAAAT